MIAFYRMKVFPIYESSSTLALILKWFNTQSFNDEVRPENWCNVTHKLKSALKNSFFPKFWKKIIIFIFLLTNFESEEKILKSISKILREKKRDFNKAVNLWSKFE